MSSAFCSLKNIFHLFRSDNFIVRAKAEGFVQCIGEIGSCVGRNIAITFLLLKVHVENNFKKKVVINDAVLKTDAVLVNMVFSFLTLK